MPPPVIGFVTQLMALDCMAARLETHLLVQCSFSECLLVSLPACLAIGVKTCHVSPKIINILLDLFTVFSSSSLISRVSFLTSCVSCDAECVGASTSSATPAAAIYRRSNIFVASSSPLDIGDYFRLLFLLMPLENK